MTEKNQANHPVLCLYTMNVQYNGPTNVCIYYPVIVSISLRIFLKFVLCILVLIHYIVDYPDYHFLVLIDSAQIL